MKQNDDLDEPGCLYDVTPCTGDCCEEGRKMYDDYIDEKYNRDEVKDD